MIKKSRRTNIIRNIIGFFKSIKRELFVAILSSVLVTIGIGLWNQAVENRRILEAVNSVYIGNSKEYLDKNLGEAAFTVNYGKYDKAIYITKPAVVMVFFDKNQKCVGYYVTQRGNYRIELPKVYAHIVGNKQIGKFSYYDIDSSPLYAFGFFTNGIGRVFYQEQYYYTSGGNYYDFSFATTDYGNTEGQYDLFAFDITEDDEIKPDMVEGGVCCSNRKRVAPNTYGIFDAEMSISDIDIYDGFDSYWLSADGFAILE